MTFCQNIDKKQLRNLLVNMLGIYILYFIAGILHENIIKKPQFNRITKTYEVCSYPAGLILVPFLVGWLLALLYNTFLIKEKVLIPNKNSCVAGIAVVAATYFSTLAIQKTSFPVVVMFQSCSIVPVVIVGVCCSRVHDPNLKLGPKKIIVALIISAGILIFQFSDPETKHRQVSEQFIGIIFLLIHFISEGFLPDLQAEIKVNYKPNPTEMMQQINKWCTIITLVIVVATMEAWNFLIFLWQHPSFTFYLILMSVLSGFGQFFVYRMIKQFKQHFVPFTISSRKILTVALSIVFYGHETNWIQILGIFIVFLTIFIQFLMQISQKKPQEANKQDIIHELNEEKFQQDKPNQDIISKQNSEEKPHYQSQEDKKYDERSFQKQNQDYRRKNGLTYDNPTKDSGQQRKQQLMQSSVSSSSKEANIEKSKNSFD